MFSRSQSYSKRGGGGPPPSPVTGAASTPNGKKLSKSRPSLDTGPASSSSSFGPASLALSPVNNVRTIGPAPDNLYVSQRNAPMSMGSAASTTSLNPDAAANTPIATTPSSTTPSNASNSNLSVIPSLPSIRSFRSRFPFGSKSGSHKKDRSVSIPTATDIIIGQDDVLEIGSLAGSSKVGTIQEHVGDMSLDPSVLRPTSPLASPNKAAMALPTHLHHDSLTLPRMQSQPNLTSASKKRKSFDFAALGARPTIPLEPRRSGVGDGRPTVADIGLGRPSFSGLRIGVKGPAGRSFTPGGTVIREALSETEADVVDVRAPSPPAQSHALSKPSSDPTITSRLNDSTPPRASMDSSTAPDSADVTRVIDLSFTAPIAVSPPTPEDAQGPTPSSSDPNMANLLLALNSSLESQRASIGHPSPMIVEKGEATWTLNELKGAMQRMSTMVNEGQKSGSRPTSPNSVIASSANTPFAFVSSPLASDLNLAGPSFVSPEIPGAKTMQLSAMSPDTIHAGETSFASARIDVEAMEQDLEKRLGKDFLLEDDDDSLDLPPMAGDAGPSILQEEDPSLDLGTLDPNLARLLSPNNLMSSSNAATSTPAKSRISARFTPRRTTMLSLNTGGYSNSFQSVSADDVTVTLSPGWGNRQRSGSIAVTTPSLTPSPLTPVSAPGVLTPTTAREFGSMALGRSRSHTPTPSAHGVFTPSKRDSVSSQVSTSSNTLPSPAYSSSTSRTAGSLSSRKPPPAPIPLVIPDELPPAKVSPETAAFPQTARRMTVTSTSAGSSSTPASPLPRKRAISIEESSPEKARRREARRQMALDAAEGSGSVNGKGRASVVDWTRERTSLVARPATSTAFHQRRLRGQSPERHASSSPQDIPPRSLTSFSFNNRSRDAPTPQPSGPPISGTRPHVVRKRRSYSIDHAGGDRTRLFASLQRSRDDAGGDGRGSIDLASNSGHSKLEAMGPLTKRAFAAAGLLEGSSRSASGAIPTSRSYGGNSWKDIRQADELGSTSPRPPLPRAATLAELMPASSRHYSKDSVSTTDHLSTPSSASGPSRTLYAPSTTSSGGPGGNTGTARTSSPSPTGGAPYLPTITVSSHTETLTLLKERHELEKDALLSAMGEMKRENQRVAKERDRLAQYVNELEERLEKAEELNRKMEGVKAMMMDIAGLDSGGGLARRSSGRPSVAVPSTSTRGRRAEEDSSPRSLAVPRDREDLSYLVTSSATIHRARKEMDRRSAVSEHSALMPSMLPSHEMSMLLHEAAPSSAGGMSEPPSPVQTTKIRPRMSNSPSFSYSYADDRESSSGGSLRLRLEDELHLADLVSMGPVSDYGGQDDDDESVF